VIRDIDLYLFGQRYASEKTGSVSHEYRCPLFNQCDCVILWKFTINVQYEVFELYCNGRHTADSHRLFKGRFLAPRQKEAIIRSVETDPNTTGSKLIRNLSNVADSELHIDHKLLVSVDRLVRTKRDEVLSKALGGVEVSGRSEDDEGKIKAMADLNRFDTAVKAHNANSSSNHFDVHEVLFTSFQFKDVLHYGLTTGHNIMNVARAINAGTLIFCTDGTFRVCRREVCVLGIRVAMLEGETATVGFSVNPTESTDAIRGTFRGFQAAFFCLFQTLKSCGKEGCSVCNNIRDIMEEEGMKKLIASSCWKSRVFGGKKFMGDDGLGHKSFVRTDFPQDMRLKCFQHINGESSYLFCAGCSRRSLIGMFVFVL